MAEISLVKRFLKERLQRDVSTFHGHQNEWKTIHDLLKRTAECGESNSVLLIGARGSGKTTLLASVLYTLLKCQEFTQNTLIVYLNGLIHTDDRLALKSATVQMNLENAVDGKVFGSFAENLAFLLECLKSGTKKESKSVIFILEEFDLFCSHHNQTLLYNLFDISQSAQAPICVMGVTCRLDVVELLEKRVKSRFSHRQVFLFPGKNTFEDRMQRFKDLLKLPNERELKTLSTIRPDMSIIERSEIRMFRNIFNPSKYAFSKKFVHSWNESIEKLSQNKTVTAALQNLYDYDVSEASFKTFLYQVVSRIDEEDISTITPENIVFLAAATENDEKVHLLGGLSVLELSLVIAMKHHTEIYDREPFNFEIIFMRFSKFAKSSSVMQGAERAVVLKSFEHLKNLEFIVPLSSAASKVQKEFQMHKMLLTCGQINQAVAKYQMLPTDVAQWAQSSLV